MQEKKLYNKEYENKSKQKVLFISEFILEKPQGATQSAKAHYESLCKLFGKKDVDVVAIDAGTQKKNKEFYCLSGIGSQIKKLKNILNGNCVYVSNGIIKDIIKLINQNNYSVIVIDNSYFGSIIKKIKKITTIPVVVYFHGVYHNASRQVLNKANIIKKIKYFPTHVSLLYNETLTAKYADKVLLLNDRDAQEFKKSCSRKADYIMPVYFEDNAKIEKKLRMEKNLKILFVGGKFAPNVNGIIWFIQKVMPRVPKDINLYIVGKDLEKVSSIIELCNKDNIHLIGTVDSLDVWYNQADVVIGPIFEGDGMKTKTAEALMYGKLYIGTAEAICGYKDLKEYQCNTDVEFEKMLKKVFEFKLPQNKYYEEFRKLYCDKYSGKAGMEIWKQVFNDCGIKYE